MSQFEFFIICTPLNQVGLTQFMYFGRLGHQKITDETLVLFAATIIIITSVIIFYVWSILIEIFSYSA